MGWRLAPTTELCFTDLRVPRRNLLSRKSHAFYQSMDLQDRFTVQMSSSVVGMAEGTLKMAFHYAKTREAFDREIGESKAISQKLPEMVTKTETQDFGSVVRAASLKRASAPIPGYSTSPRGLCHRKCHWEAIFTECNLYSDMLLAIIFYLTIQTDVLECYKTN